MNKQELIERVASKTGMTKSVAGEAVESMLACIAESLTSDEEVRLVGFGTFVVSERKASEGRNPRTGETIQIDASRSVKFRQGKELKERVNGRRNKQ